MSKINWITPAGNIAQVAEEDYFEFQLDAYDSSGSALSYKVISGTLSNGLQLYNSGLIQGIPSVEVRTISGFTQTFTVRATNASGGISDRTFNIIIDTIASPEIVPKDVSLGTLYDGYQWIHQLEANNPSTSVKQTWTLIDGELPPGITLSSSGLLYGYILPYSLPEDADILGWSAPGAGWGVILWDSPTADHQSRTYHFTVQVNDGIKYDNSTYSLRVEAKKLYTVDNDQLLINNDFITADINNKHAPIIITPASFIPIQRQNSNFAFKIDGIDIDGDEIRYALHEIDASFFDQEPTTLDPFLETVGFDSSGFDQESQTLPPGITLDEVTGWLNGFIESQVEVKKVYKFQAFCYKVDDPTNFSRPVTFTLTVLGDLNNVIDWMTPCDLGYVTNGDISELAIVAKAHLPGKELRYTLTPGIPSHLNTNPASTVITYTPTAYSKLPQGLRLLNNGLIVGRATFNYFSLDDNTTTFDKAATEFDSSYTFSITASDQTELELDADQTLIDSDVTIFDALYPADSVYGWVYNPSYEGDPDPYKWELQTQLRKTATVSDTKIFTIKVRNNNVDPYENIYLRALPSADKRLAFRNVLEDQDLFPNELIYRLEDPYYGKANNIKFLFAAGLRPSTASTYVASMQYNHYNKRIELGEVKTAVALDENFNVKYEVIYVEVIDTATNNNRSAPDVITTPFTTIYPNSLDNMESELSQITYNNRSALPGWMTNPQPDGRVLGFTRAVTLAYTVPGASKLIAYRLKQENINFGNLDFVVDRYQLDNTMSLNFNIATQEFNPSSETTFDRLPLSTDTFAYAGSVDFALTVPFDEIHGRTVEYIRRAGGLDGLLSIVTGQLLVFAEQEHFSSLGTVHKDIYDNNNFDALGYDLSTSPVVYNSPNSGWNDFTSSLYGTFEYGAEPYVVSDIIPGYLDNLYNPAIPNQRSGIWRVNVSADLLVTLEFVQQVNPNQYIQVSGGYSYSQTKIYYDPVLKEGHSVPDYTILSNVNRTPDESTVFDGHGTRFYSNKDQYSLPEFSNQFVKFTKVGMFL